MTAAFIGGDTLRSGTLTYMRDDGLQTQDTVSNTLTLHISDMDAVRGFCVRFPVGNGVSGALFSRAAARLADCTPPADWSVHKEIVPGFISFNFACKPDAARQTQAYFIFEPLICDTGEGVSVVQIQQGGQTLQLPAYRLVSDWHVSFYGDAFGDYLSNIKLGWRAENMPAQTTLTLAPADTLSGAMVLDYLEDEIEVPLLCDTTYMLIVRAGDRTLETLFHTVKIRPAEVLAFRAEKTGYAYRIHYLLKNRRDAYLNMGIGRLTPSHVWERDGDVYAEYNGDVTPVFKNKQPALIWPPDFELDAAYLVIEGMYGKQKIGETRYGAVENESGLDSFLFRIENGDERRTVKAADGADGLRLVLSNELAKTHDVVYRLCYENIGWLGWTTNGGAAGARKSGLKCVAIEAKLVKKGWAAGYVGSPEQLPAFVDYSIAKAAVTGTAIDKIKVSLCGVPFGAASVSSERGVQITLTGGAEKLYDILYRVSVPAIQGFTGWAKNGESAGFINGGVQMGSVEVKLTAKGGALTETGRYPTFIDYGKTAVTVRTYSGGSWNPAITNGVPEPSGVTVSILDCRVEIPFILGVKLLYNGLYAQSDTDESFLEGIQVKLDGENAKLFGLVCRVRTEKIGWLGWCTDGSPCGVLNRDIPITAVDVRLLPMGGGQSYSRNNDLPHRYTDDPRIERCKGFDIEKCCGFNVVGLGESSIAYKGHIERRGVFHLTLEGVAKRMCDVVYRVHVKGLGWLGWAKNGEWAGSSRPGDVVDDIEVSAIAKGLADREARYVANAFPACLEPEACDAHCQVVHEEGEWLDADPTREEPICNIRFGISGIRYDFDGVIRAWLEEGLENEYDIVYRLRVPNLGWLGWAKNGEQAGVMSIKGVKTPNGIEAKLLPREGGIRHCNSGDLPPFVDFTTAKITAEFFENSFTLTKTGAEGISIEYRGYCPKTGWDKTWTREGVACPREAGDVLEGIQVRTAGAAARLYELFCRVEIAGIGWLGWTKDGMAGTPGLGWSCTGMAFRLKPKKSVPSIRYRFNHPPAFIDLSKLRTYQIGSIEPNAPPLKDVRFQFEGLVGCRVEYLTCYSDTGWESLWRFCGEDCNPNPQPGSGFIEAVKVQLNSGAEQLLDIAYRVYTSGVGWRDWVSGGEQAGDAGGGKPCTAIEIKLSLDKFLKRGVREYDRHPD